MALRRPRWHKLGALLLVVVAALVAGRIMLPTMLQWYVNQQLELSELYTGEVGDIDVYLYRGAYSLENVRVNKSVGAVPAPLFTADRVDLALEWPSLLRGKVVGRIEIERPTLNFVDGESDADDQTGVGGPWLQIIRDLFAFRINSVVVRDGSIHFHTWHQQRPVSVYLSELEATVENLTNIHDEVTPLVTEVTASAMAMDQADFEFRMNLDPFAYRPTFQLIARLVSLDVTTINEMSLAYGGFDFERGWFDLVIEIDAKEGLLEGYVKPLFRDVQIVSLAADGGEDDLPRLLWETLVGATVALLSNPARDQFGTLIPFTGDVSSPDTDILAVVGNVLRNAFIRAYLPTLHDKRPAGTGLEFGPAQVDDPVLQGAQP